MISFGCAFAVFLLFSEHIRMAATDYHSNLSIIPDIFRYYNKVLFNDRCSRWNMSNHMLSKGKKKRTKKVINTIVITRHNAIAMSRDLQSWRSSFSPFKYIYYFQFLIFEIIRFVVWFYVLSVVFPCLLISLIFVSLICF